MFGILSTLVGFIGGIFEGGRQIHETNVRRQGSWESYYNGYNLTNTYHDAWGNDRDLFTDRNVIIKTDYATGHTLVCDAKTGEVIRNCSLNKKYTYADIEKNKYNGQKVVKLYSIGQMRSMWFDKFINFKPEYAQKYVPKDIPIMYLHCATKRKCFEITCSPYNNIGQIETGYFKEKFKDEEIYGIKGIEYYVDIYTGEIIDYEFDKFSTSMKVVSGKKDKYNNPTYYSIAIEDVINVINLYNMNIRNGMAKKPYAEWNPLISLI